MLLCATPTEEEADVEAVPVTLDAVEDEEAALDDDGDRATGESISFCALPLLLSCLVVNVDVTVGAGGGVGVGVGAGVAALKIVDVVELKAFVASCDDLFSD